MKAKMTFAPAVLACLFYLALSLPAPAAAADGKPVDFNGMRITVLKPWELLTTDTDGKKLKNQLGLALSGDGEILGEGWATAYPAKKDRPLPAPAELKGMHANALKALAHDLKKTYTGFSDEDQGAPSLTEINGFTAIAFQWKEKPKEANGCTSYDFSYYFVLKDRLVTLRVGVCGDEAAGKLLERICRSFVPAVK
jgi:hypothetical protein